jgi:hypothetical protein
MSNTSYIVVPNAFSNDLCYRIVAFFLKYEKDYSVTTTYGMHENTWTNRITLEASPVFLAEDKSYWKECNALINEIVCSLSSAVLDHIAPKLQNLPFWNNVRDILDLPLYFSPFQLRRVLKETREHTDDIDPSVLIRYNGTHALLCREASILVTLSETTDEFVFPAIKEKVPLRKGELLLFPPYWTHPHASIVDKTTNMAANNRFSFQTWLQSERHMKYNHESNLIRMI